MADYTRELKIAEIIVRQELGELSGEDQEFLDQWLEESGEHVLFYRDLLQKPDIVKPVPEFETERFVKATARKIQQRKIRILTIRAAAVAAVLLTGIFSVYFLQRIPPAENPPAATVIAGRTQAVLSLPDGQQIELGSEEKEEETAWKKYAAEYDKEQLPATAATDMKIEVSGGGEYKVRLDDGTVVWLNSESTLIYPEKFTGEKRVVSISGEAYFEVARNETKPFIVSVADVEIKVLGTSFNVAAYQDEETIATTLVAGSVEVSTPCKSVKLVPGNQAVVQKGQPGIAISEVDPALFSSWTTGIFKFDKMPLTDICKRLSRWYNVGFVFEGDCGNEKFTGGTWKYVSLQDFLSKIERVTDVSFQVKPGTVVVTRKK